MIHDSPNMTSTVPILTRMTVTREGYVAARLSFPGGRQVTLYVDNASGESHVAVHEGGSLVWDGTFADAAAAGAYAVAEGVLDQALSRRIVSAVTSS